MYKQIPELVAAREARQREADKFLQLSEKSSTALMADALQQDLQTQMINEGVGPVKRFIKNSVLESRRGRGWMGLGGFFGSDEGFIESFSPMASPDMKAGLNDFERASANMAAAAEKLTTAADVLGQSVQQHSDTNRMRAAVARPPE
jgi:hypothetical protein